MNFLAELRRRNVIRMAGLYLVAAWLITQVADTVLPMFGAPIWLPRSVVLILAIGFMPALVFAWIFELTPDGLRRDAGGGAADSSAPQTARRLDRMIIAVLLLALTYFGVDKFVLAPQRDAALRVAAEQRGAARIDAQDVADADAAVPSASIAVLPLANTSGDQDQLYFSDGLSEDLITALSQFDDLKVIGRNSAFKFRNSKHDAKAIGAELGVAHLVEGSVRRDGDTVRITAQLVRVADGSTVWSQRYDRPYSDLFALQDEITSAIANALKARLLAGNGAVAQRNRPSSGNLEAYNAYLQGKFHYARGTEADLRRAIDAYGTATRGAPQFAQAWASLSNAWTSLSARFLEGAEMRQGYAHARDAVDTALSLDANLADAHLARGKLLLYADFDWIGGEAEYRRALLLSPNDGSARASLAEVLATLGHPDQAVELTRQALETDALNAASYHSLATYLMPLGRLDEAEQALRKAIRLQPTAMGNREQLAIIGILRGDAAAALHFARQERKGDWQDAALARARQIGDDPVAADAALQTLVDRQAGKAAYQIAQVHALRKDPDKVFEWLDRAWANRDAGVSLLLYDPLLMHYRDDLRFAAFARKIGLPAQGTSPASASAP